MSNGMPDPSDLADPSKMIENLEPEMVDGPLDIPVVKPKGAPDLPDTDLSDMDMMDRDY